VTAVVGGPLLLFIQLTISSFVLPPEKSVGSPFTNHFNVGYPLTPYFPPRDV